MKEEFSTLLRNNTWTLVHYLLTEVQLGINWSSGLNTMPMALSTSTKLGWRQRDPTNKKVLVFMKHLAQLSNNHSNSAHNSSVEEMAYSPSGLE